MYTHRSTLALSTLAVAAALALSACDRTGPDQTAGQKVDSAVNTMEKKADAAGDSIKQGAESVKQSANQAADTVGDKARDATITTQVNADLARDPELSALKIDVDTVDGKVVLKGSAPNDSAKERASAKAQAVVGVKSVDNQLRVGS